MNKIKKIAIDSGTNAVGAGVGLVLAGPPGAIVGAIIPPILSDVLGRMLSKKEKTRVEKIAEIATREIQKKIESGAKPTANAHGEKIKELFEGTLLAAKDSYEEKKIPLLAHLFATAPFTNTPLENIIQSLKTAESLSYRRLCILAVIGKNQENVLALSITSYKDKYRLLPRNEERDGIYFDILSLLSEGIIIQVENDDSHIASISVVANIIPAKLKLYYSGNLLLNSLQLDSIFEGELMYVVDLMK